jgi:tetratricopeptide (TPR) repeat protein
MKTILTLFLTVLLHSTYCQSIDSLSKSKLLNELSENACKCIDSINVNNIDHKKVTEEVNRCITAQIGAYQIGIKLMEIDSLSKIALEKDGKKEINISLEFDENSDKYKEYYYDMERYLMDNCSSIKSKIAVNDKESAKSISSNPKALELYSKGLKEVDKEKYEEAIDYFDKALKIDPDFAFAWDYLGLCHRKAGNYDKAIIAYENSLKVDPEGIMPLQNIAVAYAYKMEYTKAIEAYQRLAKIDDKNPEVYYGIGNIYTMHLSDYENGLKYMCKAYNLYIEQKSPYRTDAEKIINIIYTEMKKQDKENRFVEILKENNIRTE